jgi:hypothetical protein
MNQSNPNKLQKLLGALSLATALLVGGGAHAAYETVVGSYTWTLWNNAYPWGNTHNGSARMLSSKVTMGGSSLGIRADRIASSGTIRFESGTIWAKHLVRLNDQFPNYTLEGRFAVPYQSGAWPAFWFTSTGGWDLESDIMEFKGNNTCWQNTYDWGRWQNKLTAVSNPAATHTYKAWVNKISATELEIHYYIDGSWKAAHRMRNAVNRDNYVIIDLQTEGSSGSASFNSISMSSSSIHIGRTRAF